MHNPIIAISGRRGGRLDLRRGLVQGPGQALAAGAGARIPTTARTRRCRWAAGGVLPGGAGDVGGASTTCWPAWGWWASAPSALVGLTIGVGLILLSSPGQQHVPAEAMTLTVIDAGHWALAVVIEAVVIALLA